MKKLCRILSLATVLILTACTQKELCFDHDHRTNLRLVFDWRDAPDASPRGMVVWFYPAEAPSAEGEDGGTYLRFDIAGTEGADIKVPVGRYHIITYNNDTELARFRGTDIIHDHHAYTREGSILEPATGNRNTRNDELPRPPGTENERVTVSPDELWGCATFDIEVGESGVITLFPHELFCRYSYEVRNVKNAESVTRMCGILTGMSPTLHFHDESLSEETVSIPLPAYLDGPTIRGEFLTFGHHAELDTPHHFGLYLWLRDGQTLFYGKEGDGYDVTDQIHAAADPRRVHFIIDGLELPTTMGSGGWTASFEDWGEVNEDIVM